MALWQTAIVSRDQRKKKKKRGFISKKKLTLGILICASIQACCNPLLNIDLGNGVGILVMLTLMGEASLPTERSDGRMDTDPYILNERFSRKIP